MNRLIWLATVGFLVAAIAVLPRISPEPGEDVYPSHIGLGDRASLAGGDVEVSRVTVSRQLVDGDQTHQLPGGYFVEVQAVIRPHKDASSISMSIDSDGRSFDESDLSPYVERGEPGFDTPVRVIFEVPKDVVGHGEVHLQYRRHSVATLSLDEGNIKRVSQLEKSR